MIYRLILLVNNIFCPDLKRIRRSRHQVSGIWYKLLQLFETEYYRDEYTDEVFYYDY